MQTTSRHKQVKATEKSPWPKQIVLYTRFICLFSSMAELDRDKTAKGMTVLLPELEENVLLVIPYGYESFFGNKTYSLLYPSNFKGKEIL